MRRAVRRPGKEEGHPVPAVEPWRQARDGRNDPVDAVDLVLFHHLEAPVLDQLDQAGLAGTHRVGLDRPRRDHLRGVDRGDAAGV